MIGVSMVPPGVHEVNLMQGFERQAGGRRCCMEGGT